MGRKAEKGKAGEAVQYYSRKQALRHLQIGLPNFIRLCLWKGIYPSQPNNIKAAGKGDSRPKIYYKRKDINLLLHEPVLNKLREIRAFNVKLKRAKERNDKDKMYRLMKSKPRYTLSHVVKELYPTIEDALQNINDCLKSIFLFATLPKMTQFNGSYIQLCKRLKLEFMNYCIATQALRKCFISVKGYFLEVEILGNLIRWIIPHQHATMSLPSSCDYRMLANQMEFDTYFLRSVLCNLYTNASLSYPPKFAVDPSGNGCDWSESEILASMAFALARADENDEEKTEETRKQQLAQLREMDEDIAATVDMETAKRDVQSVFRGKKIFLSREVPREIFCFVLRCCGATEVSWDSSVASGATFDENDAGIEFHVVDRTNLGAETRSASRVSRFYVQPQFVFDCINARRLLPVRDYMPGVQTIPHLCPFADYSKGYVPPEYRYLQGEIDADALYDVPDDEEEHQVAIEEQEEEEIDEDGLNDDEEEEEEDEFNEDELEEMKVDEKEPRKLSKNIKKAKSKPKNEKKKKPVAKQPRISKQELLKQIAINREIKLREMDLPKKRLNLYKKMKHCEKKEKSTVEKLKQKRQEVNKRRSSGKK